jgi:hypothetical protein
MGFCSAHFSFSLQPNFAFDFWMYREEMHVSEEPFSQKNVLSLKASLHTDRVVGQCEGRSGLTDKYNYLLDNLTFSCVLDS